MGLAAAAAAALAMAFPENAAFVDLADDRSGSAPAINFCRQEAASATFR
jgi:hypothetical protein